jgi:hypothetical protein
MKKFCIAGPVNPEKHYYVSGRLNEQEIWDLIHDEKYFILHAPRQSGKTTAFKDFAQRLNNEGTYTALYVNVETAQTERGVVARGIPVVLREIVSRAKIQLNPSDPIFNLYEDVKKESVEASSALKYLLENWAVCAEKPIVLIIDEIDSLVGDTLISVLRQLRSGYDQRPKNFPQAICLIGVRDVRDYMIWSDVEQKAILGGSAFNIKAKSLILSDFTIEQTKDLLLQHTNQTGQTFTDEAIFYIFEQTQGQPWLTNALAYQACFEDETDRSVQITKEILEYARETLIKRQDTHLDVLINRLNEPRVCAVIDAIINGTSERPLAVDDDFKYVQDLGLIKISSTDMWISNPIYKEILPRALSDKFQKYMGGRSVDYVRSDGTIDMYKLMEKFSDFFRQNADIWLEESNYKESGPHLIFFAFLQRIINGGGVIHREYALGRGRVDLLVLWAGQRIVIELKLWKGEKALEEGLMQTAGYMDISNATEGHLVIFDRRPGRSWSEKVYHQSKTFGNKTIMVWGV